MRYAIVSDLHANLQAFEAVLTDLSVQHAGRVLCLGDAIGYGPQPAEVLSLVHAHVHEMLMGNHEAAAAELITTEDFSAGARASLTNTRRKLNQAAMDYIRALPYELEHSTFRCTHADFADPRGFGYVETPEDALRSFAATAEPLLFLGHTHEATVFVLKPDGTCVQAPPEDFTLAPGHRYLVNPGSVGMPRTADPRATYCIYDRDAGRVSFHHTSYGVREFRKLVEADAQTGEQLAYMLSLLDDHALPVLQARANFAAAAPRPAVRRPMTVPRPAPAAAAPKPTKPPEPAPGPTPRSRVLWAVTTSLTLSAAAIGTFLWVRAHQGPARRHVVIVRAELPAAPAASAEPEGTAVRVQFDGRHEKVPFELVSGTPEAKIYFNKLADADASNCLAVFTVPATNTAWQQATWVVRPRRTGTVDLRLEARWSQGGPAYWMLYDDVALEGAKLADGDFEAGDQARKTWGLTSPVGKATLEMEKSLAHEGTVCVKAGSRGPAVQTLQVEDGRPLTLTFWYRAPPAAK